MQSPGRTRMSRHKSRKATALAAPAALVPPNSETGITTDWADPDGPPLVSIICHAFNHAGFIADAIRGFLAQRTDFPFEIIVRDDASTDGTDRIIAGFARQYPRLLRVVLESENRYAQGVMPSTVTFPLARGLFIALCEGDDFWCDTTKLQRQMALLRQEPTAGIAIHPATMLVLDENDNRTQPFCEHGPHPALLPVTGVFAHYGQFAPTSSYLVRAECVPDWQWFLAHNQPTFGDFFLECIGSRGHLAYLPEAMSVYRRNHAGSYSAGERKVDGAMLLSRFHRNADATVALRHFPWVTDDDIRRRLAVLRLDYLRKLARVGAFAEINTLATDGPIALQAPSDWLHLHLSRRMPRLARFAARRWRRWHVPPASMAPGTQP